MKVYVLENGVALPASGTYFVIGRDGMYLRKENVVGSALVPVQHISFLREAAEKAVYHLPRLPTALVADIFAFFRQVYENHKSEAIVLVHYSEAEHIFLLSCPKQLVDGSGVHHYDATERFDGYLLVGSVHSHADMSAIHSCTDQEDEEQFDGVHCIIGRFDTDYVEIRCSLVMNGTRFSVAPKHVFEGITRVKEPEPRRVAMAARPTEEQLELFERFMRRRQRRLDRTGRAWLDAGDGDMLMRHPEARSFDLTLPDSTDWRTLTPPAGWMERVVTIAALRKVMARDGDDDDKRGAPAAGEVIATLWQPGGDQ